ncbi:MAG: TetR family transcriptional regulator [Candidatus Acidiferrales bacterium]|jgi:AcrR family transcriptional regulator
MASPIPAARRATPSREGRRERRHTEIRERLFRSALQLFAERGYFETTVEDITEAADVGKGTFFNYFPTKEHVLATFGAERIAVVERALEEARKGPVLPVLKRLAGDLAGQSAESAALLRAIYAAHASCEPVRAELHKRLQTVRRLVTEIFTLAQKRGEVRRDMPAAELARLTQIVLLGVTLAWAMNPDSSLHRTTAEVWDLFSPGLYADEKGRNAKSRRSVKT